MHKIGRAAKDKQGKLVYVEIVPWNPSRNQVWTILETIDLQSLISQDDFISVREIFFSMDPDNFHMVQSGHGLLTFMYAICYF